jgi:hypothetical protein
MVRERLMAGGVELKDLLDDRWPELPRCPRRFFRFLRRRSKPTQQRAQVEPTIGVRGDVLAQRLLIPSSGQSKQRSRGDERMRSSSVEVLLAS